MFVSVYVFIWPFLPKKFCAKIFNSLFQNMIRKRWTSKGNGTKAVNFIAVVDNKCGRLIKWSNNGLMKPEGFKVKIFRSRRDKQTSISGRPWGPLLTFAIMFLLYFYSCNSLFVLVEEPFTHLFDFEESLCFLNSDYWFRFLEMKSITFFKTGSCQTAHGTLLIFLLFISLSSFNHNFMFIFNWIFILKRCNKKFPDRSGQRRSTLHILY